MWDDNENKASDDVLKSKPWTDEELRAAGFSQFLRKKEVVLARVIGDDEAPKHIKTSQGDTLIAQSGYFICYMAGYERRETLDDYEQWPVEPTIFQDTYRVWDESWQPTPAEEHLLHYGCKPYYKFAGVWAKEVDEDTVYQSLEHENPAVAPTGTFLAIGKQGEPYTMGKKTFHSRYEPGAPKRSDLSTQRSWVKRLIGLFKRE